MDLYSMLARSWELPRKDAKMRFLLLLEAAGANMNFAVWSDEYTRLARCQPHVLDNIPEDVRFEMLAHYGIHLGVN